MAYSLKNILHGSISISFSQVLSRIIAIVLLPIYTRFLTPADFGKVGYLVVFVALLSNIMMFGAYGAQNRFYYSFKNDIKEVGRLLFSINASVSVFSIIACIVLTLGGQWIYGLFKPPADVPFYPYALIAIWIIPFTIMHKMAASYYTATKQFGKFTGLQVLDLALATVAGLFFVVLLRGGAVGRLWGMLAAEALFVGCTYWAFAKYFKPEFRWVHVSNAIIFSAPLVLHLMAVTTHEYIDRVILGRYVPISDLGIYTLAYTIGLFINVIISSLNQAWTPNYYDLHTNSSVSERKRVQYKYYALWLITVGFLAIVANGTAHLVVKVLTPPAYHAATGLVPFIIAAHFLQGIYNFAIAPAMQQKKTLRVPMVTISAALANIGFNLVLIPRFGVIGAAWATVMSFMIMAAVAIIMTHNINELKMLGLRPVILILAVVGSGIFIGNRGNDPGILFPMLFSLGYCSICLLIYPRLIASSSRAIIHKIGKRFPVVLFNK